MATSMLLLYELGASFLAAASVAYVAKRLIGTRHTGHWFYIFPAAGIGFSQITFPEPVAEIHAAAATVFAFCLTLGIGASVSVRRTQRQSSQLAAEARWVATDWIVFLLFIAGLAASLAWSAT